MSPFARLLIAAYLPMLGRFHLVENVDARPREGGAPRPRGGKRSSVVDVRRAPPRVETAPASLAA